MHKVFLKHLVVFCSNVAGGFLVVAFFMSWGTYFRDAKWCTSSFGWFASKCDYIDILEWGLVGGIVMAAINLLVYFIIAILTLIVQLIRRFNIHK